jgi:adenosylcobinamide kinase/adenosylcobinamide-phosphate guanylyltransferase
MGKLILVTGGARSGKSDFAEQLAAKLGGEEVLFVATAEALDADMTARIAAHRRSRLAGWLTEEAPRNVGERLRAAIGSRRVALVDCLTLLVSNTILTLGETPQLPEAEQLVEREVAELVAACDASPATVIIVTNEVGLGLVPMNALGRVFRDTLGRANQKLAARADSVYALISGIPIDVKLLASQSKENDKVNLLPPGEGGGAAAG